MQKDIDFKWSISSHKRHYITDRSTALAEGRSYFIIIYNNKIIIELFIIIIMDNHAQYS